MSDWAVRACLCARPSILKRILVMAIEGCARKHARTGLAWRLENHSCRGVCTRTQQFIAALMLLLITKRDHRVHLHRSAGWNNTGHD
jgi:hypothetical protein